MFNYYSREDFDNQKGQGMQYNGYNKNDRDEWDDDDKCNLYPEEAKFFFEGFVHADKNDRDYDKKEEKDYRDEKWDHDRKDECKKCNHRPCCRPCFPCFPCFNRRCNCHQNNRDFDECNKKEQDNEWKERPYQDRCQEQKPYKHNNDRKNCDKDDRKKETVLFINGRIVIKDC